MSVLSRSSEMAVIDVTWHRSVVIELLPRVMVSDVVVDACAPTEVELVEDPETLAE